MGRQRAGLVGVIAAVAFWGASAAVPAVAQSILPGHWSGPYWGIGAGATWADVSNSGTNTDFAISGHAGYGLQLSNFYVGGEADVTWGGMTTTSRFSPLYSSTLEVDWSASLRGRAGITFAGLMVYGTAGAAWSGQSLAIHSLGQPDAVSTRRIPGIVYGAGVEMKVLPNISARIEALRYDFSAQSGSFSGAFPGAISAAARNGINADETVVRAGVSLRFN